MPVSTIGSAGLTSPLTGMTISSPTLTTPNINSAQVATVSGTAPLYMCRAWVNFNGTGTVAIRASGNVSSITDNGLGDYTVNFTNAMPDANYAVSGSAGDYTGGTQNRMGIDPKIFATGSIRINVDNTSSTTDQNAVCVSVFR